jgi:hypothetical protein
MMKVICDVDYVAIRKLRLMQLRNFEIIDYPASGILLRSFRKV